MVTWPPGLPRVLLRRRYILIQGILGYLMRAVDIGREVILQGDAISGGQGFDFSVTLSIIPRRLEAENEGFEHLHKCSPYFIFSHVGRLPMMFAGVVTQLKMELQRS